MCSRLKCGCSRKWLNRNSQSEALRQEAGSCFACAHRKQAELTMRSLCPTIGWRRLQRILGKQIWGKSSVKQPRVIFLFPGTWDCFWGVAVVCSICLMQTGKFVQPTAVRLVAKVNSPWYYEFARNINDGRRGGRFLGVWLFVNFSNCYRL